jgi:hypothetical protein
VSNTLELFHDSKWPEADVLEKMIALESLVTNICQDLGCKRENPIQFLDLEPPTYSLYRFDSEEIVLPRSELDRPDSNYDLAYFAIHETRHHIQKWKTIYHREDEKKTVELWYKNMNTYINQDELRVHYRFQPVERDAYDFADQKFVQLFNSLEKELGPCKGLQNYIEKIQHRNKTYHIMAEQQLGKNYLQKIDRTIEDLYQAKIHLLHQSKKAEQIIKKYDKVAFERIKQDFQALREAFQDRESLSSHQLNEDLER